MDNFVISLPIFNCLQTCQLVSQHCRPKWQLAFLPDAHWKSGKPSLSIPLKIAPNIWILTTAPSAVITTITLICPGETTKFIMAKSQFTSCNYPPACSATLTNFHLPPCYDNTPLEVNISVDMVNLKHDQHFIIRFSYMATPRETAE